MTIFQEMRDDTIAMESQKDGRTCAIEWSSDGQLLSVGTRQVKYKSHGSDWLIRDEGENLQLLSENDYPSC